MNCKENKKWGWYSCIVLPILLAGSIILGACSFSDSGSSNPGPAPESEYKVLSTNSFMGGSLMYSQKGGQLSPGRTFGVRFGTLQKITKHGEQGEAANFDVYEEIDNAERFGTIRIISVSTDGIYFTSSIYSKDGKSKTTSTHNLKTGQSADLTGDGKADVTYKVPGVKRSYFGDSRYLTFICNDTGLYTTMFSHYDKEAAGEAISGFFGINADGNFLMLTDKEPNVVPEGFADGDFIIYHYDPTVYVTNQDYNAKAAGVEVYGVVAEVNSDGTYKGMGLKKASDFKLGTESYDWESFETYYYIPEQFPDDNGPKELLQAFPSEVINEGFNIDTASKVDCVAELNKIIVDPNKVGIIFKVYGIELEGKELDIFNKYKDDTSSKDYNSSNRTGLVAQYLAVVRPYIDDYYDDSPDGQTDVPDFSNAYVYLALDMGSYSDFASIIQSQQDNSARLAMASNYDAYINKSKAIEAKFKGYRSKDIDLGTLTDLGASLKAGVRGDLTITKKKASGYLGVAAFLLFELDGSDLPPIKDKRLGGKDLSLAQTFVVGFIPLNIRMDGNFEFTMDVEAKISNFYAGFTGLYGGQVDFGAYWSFFPPSISFSLGRNAFAEAEWYAGKKDKDVKIELESAKVTLHPKFAISLGGGVGPEYAFANITLPCNLKGNLPYTWDSKDKKIKDEDKTIDTTITVGAKLGVIIPVVKKEFSKEYTVATIFDKQLNLRDMTWKYPYKKN